MNDVSVAENAADILNIEPEQYVTQIFQPFQRRLMKAIDHAKGLEFDVKTTAGMKLAVAHRAEFRDLLTELEAARKERKAPILEISRLLDSRAKEVAALIAPHKERFDKLIKAEEARKEAEKQAKLAAERERVNTIQDCIREFRVAPRAMPGKTAAEFRQHADDLAKTEVKVEFYQEFHEEALTARDEAVVEMRRIADQAAAREQEAARLAAERAEFQKMRAEQEERERVAAAERADAEKRAAEAMRREREAHEVRMAAEKAELARQQAEVDAERRRQEQAAEAVRRAEQERQEAAERERREQEAEAARREAQARKDAEDAERIRQQADFERTGPTPEAIIHMLSSTHQVSRDVALSWLRKTNWKKIEVSQ